MRFQLAPLPIGAEMEMEMQRLLKRTHRSLVALGFLALLLDGSQKSLMSHLEEVLVVGASRIPCWQSSWLV